jgi:hypothetical protein
MADFAGVLLDLDAQVFAGGELIFGKCGDESPPSHPLSGTLAPAADQIPRVVVNTGILSIRGGRQKGKIAQIASLATGSILSRIKVYYPAQATGLKQLFLGIVQGLR